MDQQSAALLRYLVRPPVGQLPAAGSKLPEPVRPNVLLSCPLFLYIHLLRSGLTSTRSGLTSESLCILSLASLFAFQCSGFHPSDPYFLPASGFLPLVLDHPELTGCSGRSPVFSSFLFLLPVCWGQDYYSKLTANTLCNHGVPPLQTWDRYHSVLLDPGWDAPWLPGRDTEAYSFLFSLSMWPFLVPGGML